MSEWSCDEARQHAAKARTHEEASGRWGDQARDFSAKAEAAPRGSEAEARARCAASEALASASEQRALARRATARAWFAEAGARQRDEAHGQAVEEPT